MSKKKKVSWDWQHYALIGGVVLVALIVIFIVAKPQSEEAIAGQAIGEAVGAGLSSLATDSVEKTGCLCDECVSVPVPAGELSNMMDISGHNVQLEGMFETQMESKANLMQQQSSGMALAGKAFHSAAGQDTFYMMEVCNPGSCDCGEVTKKKGIPGESTSEATTDVLYEVKATSEANTDVLYEIKVETDCPEPIVCDAGPSKEVKSTPRSNVVEETAEEEVAVVEDEVAVVEDDSPMVFKEITIEGDNLKAIASLWGTNPNNVYAVGGGGQILHWDGNQLTKMTSGTSKLLRDVWGSGPNDIFAVGDEGRILHYEGTNWKLMKSGTTKTLNGVWGTGPNNVYAVGDNGIMIHYDGNSWNEIDSGTIQYLKEVFGFSANNIYATGSLGEVVHYDGSGWSSIHDHKILGQPPTEDGSYFSYNYFMSIWGNNPSNLYFAGYQSMGKFGGILKYDGTTWEHEEDNLIANIYAETSGDWCGVPGELGCKLYGIHGSSSNDIYAVGYGGVILHYDGNSWSGDLDTSDLYKFYQDVLTFGDEVFIVGSGLYGTFLHGTK
jgi:hypothetical protein